MTSGERLWEQKLLPQVWGVHLKYDLAILLNWLNFIFNQFNFIELLEVVNYMVFWLFKTGDGSLNSVIKLPFKLAYGAINQCATGDLTNGLITVIFWFGAWKAKGTSRTGIHC